MTHFSYDTVGFDLDGTLVDSGADLTAAINHALAGVGRAAVNIDRVRAMIGGGGRRTLRLAMEETGGAAGVDLDAAHAAMMAFYAEHIADRTRAFDGVEAMLEELATRGVTLAIVTNKSEALAQKLLAALDLRRHFACVIGGDTLGAGNGKPSPAPIHEMIARCGGGAAAFVGDSIYDVKAARAADVPVVAVDFGISPEPAETLGADAIVRTFADLIPTLETLSRR